MMDIEDLENRSQTQLVKEQLKEKRKHLDIVQESIEFQSSNMPNEDDLQGYIDMTKKDHVYCGIAQLFALTKKYNIPSRVLYNYGKDNEYEQVFNHEANKIGKPTLPILTVAHINGNHFQFVDD